MQSIHMVKIIFKKISREKDCSNYNHLWLELWWVSDSPNRPENFGTLSYFSKFERCNQLEPEHFVFHSTKPLVAIENLKGNSEDIN